jgi:hypothetical protein
LAEYAAARHGQWDHYRVIQDLLAVMGRGDGSNDRLVIVEPVEIDWNGILIEQGCDVGNTLYTDTRTHEKWLITLTLIDLVCHLR